MSIHLKDLVDNPNLLKEIREKKNPLEPKKIEDHFEALGKIIEENPIVSAGIRRS